MRAAPRRSSCRRRLAASVLVAASLGACTLGPDFEPPAPLPVTEYTAGPAVAATAATATHGGAAQQLVAERDIPHEWWTLFQSAALDDLVRRALADSPTIDAAEASLRRASEVLDGRTGGTRLPDIDASLAGVRVDAEPEAVGAASLPVNFPLNLYFASVGISYSFDLFGAGRRELEALRSQVDFERFELEAARLMLAGNVVTSAIREAALREQIARVEDLVSAQQRQLSINELRQQAGAVAELDLLLLRNELAATRATLPALRLQLEQLRHRLAEFTGQPPGTAALPDFRLADLQLPVELPLSLPSQLARQRPDIQAAEALLHRASAEVGVATANLYPQLTLSANAGLLGAETDNLNPFSLLSGSLLQPVFRGGELRSRQRVAVASFEQAGAVYRQVVLQGFREVADTLRAIEADAAILRDLSSAATDAQAIYAMTTRRYEAGAVSTLDLLDAQQHYVRAAIAQSEAVSDRFANTAALFQALGGGWWNEASATPEQ